VCCITRKRTSAGNHPKLPQQTQAFIDGGRLGPSCGEACGGAGTELGASGLDRRDGIGNRGGAAAGSGCDAGIG